MTSLAKYEAARAALAEARSVDEVKDIRDKAEAMRLYARMANDTELELHAAELRLRAERRLGEMIREQKKGAGLHEGGRPRKTCSVEEQVSKLPTLAELGIDRKLSSRAQKIASISELAFEAALDRVRERVSARDGKVSFDITANAQSRRELAEELSQSTALSPTGRKFPIVYADPAWRRKAGIGDRAYENHFPTQTWDEIIAMPVKERVLPDAWLFLWIPRAHLLALHPTEIDTPLGRTTVKLPLAYAVAQAWGFNAYSTCFIWTKTDEERPEDHGLGLIVWDQDEVLCLFKRGCGLPKPDTDVKIGSNHRERRGAHSAKPTYYRAMINAMTGGLPVLELFAREDEGHPLPANFFTWGNQSKNTAEQPPHEAIPHNIEEIRVAG
jgi:N6-adenosine-specific RNA methylase IME4